MLMAKYPGIKIICSEITPRKVRRDTEMLQCNKLLNGYASSMGNIYVAHHSNLRDETYSNLYDIKHLKENIIPRFASNIKRALISVHGHLL